MTAKKQKNITQNYLYSCALALFTAVLAIAFGQSNTIGTIHPNHRIVLAGLTILFLGWVIFKMKAQLAENETTQEFPVSRMKKMSFIWLGLALVLSISILKTPLQQLLSSETEPFKWKSYASLILGTTTLGASIFRLISQLRQ